LGENKLKKIMKILLINTFLYRRGGDCTYMFSLGELLKSNGHEVFYWGMKHPLNIIHEYEDYFPEYIDYVEMNANKNPINAFKVLIRSIYSLESKKKLEKFLYIVKPDIVHLNNIHAHLTPSIIDVIYKRNIQIIWTLHDYKLLCPDTHFLSNGKICEKCKGKKFYNCVLNRCKKNSLTASFVATTEAYFHQLLKMHQKVDYLIAPSEFLKSKYVEFGWDKSKVEFVRNFLPNFPQNNHYIEKDYILYFGGLSPWKGILTLIEAMKELNKIELFIVGAGTEKDGIEKNIKENNITNVHLLGYKSGDELIKIVNESKFIIVPSEWYENCPYSIMEAMAIGKPVIGANIGGIPELIEDGKTGLLYQSGNVEELKNKIEWLYKRPEKINKFGEKAQLKAEKEFSSELYYKRIINIYRNAMKEHK